MATPTYQGQGQPIANGGGSLLGSLGSFFGATTPVYAVAPAPVTTPVASDPKGIASAVMTCPIDPAALASGQVTVVVAEDFSDGRIALDPEALAAGQIAIVVPRSALLNRSDS